jgi:hypothetical protein
MLLGSSELKGPVSLETKPQLEMSKTVIKAKTNFIFVIIFISFFIIFEL